ncbi:MAG TPA: hypothetical protein VHQ47_00710 [Phycisphaerae bacterium]|nr:hypothetical protein [Phycisphaerae bacterium]
MSETPQPPPEEKDKVPLVPEYRGKVLDYRKPPENHGGSAILQVLGGGFGYLGLLAGTVFLGRSLLDYPWGYWVEPIIAFVIFALLAWLLRAPVAFLTGLIVFVLMLTICSICGVLMQGI